MILLNKNLQKNWPSDNIIIILARTPDYVRGVVSLSHSVSRVFLHTKRKPKRKRKLSLKFVAYSLIFLLVLYIESSIMFAHS